MNDRRVSPLDDWTVRPADPAAIPITAEWPIPAVVPGSVHVDLLRHGLIPDPFVDTNEHALRWIGDSDWVYECDAEIGPDAAAADRVDLVFDGLDTIAEISVDGTLVGSTENMHRSYRFPVDALRRPGRHRIAVEFRSATKEAERRRAEWGDWPSSSFGRPYNYVRKMACSWGWDWGPWVTSVGIWRRACIEGWRACRLARVVPDVEIGATSDVGRVGLRVHLESPVESAQLATSALELRASLVGPDGETCTATDVAVEGSDPVDLDLRAGHVDRWHVRGRGAQPLYELRVELRSSGTTLDVWSRRVGFRSVELVRGPDDAGSEFTFVVNGEALFVRGVNWIPDDPLVARVDRARYRERLADAAELGVDLVRVWGGGIYESDDFYDACDELGILVWQDFAFACAAYPEEQLDAEVEAEAREQVARLASHPSLAIWNGNNENSWGYVDWGWRPLLGGRPWGDGWYRSTLPAVVDEIDPRRPYSVASPYSGSPALHPNADGHGTKHVWDVWNEVDYAQYRRYVPRFVSEFGWQAPATGTTLRAASSDELRIGSETMANRQKASDGEHKLRTGLATHFVEPTDVDRWIWAMQLNQARAVRTGVEHFRSYRGLCMGVVWWQFNDCWPAISWAVLDSGGRRKPAWFALRSALADRLLTIQPRGADLVAVAINDGQDPWVDEVTIRRHGFDGEVCAEDRWGIDVPGGASSTTTLPRSVATATDPTAELVRASSSTAAAEDAHWFFDVDRRLDYPSPSMRVERVEGAVRVTADAFIRDLALIPERIDADARVDRMLHTLLPGDSITISITGSIAGPPRALTAAAVEPAIETANGLVVR